MFVCLFVCLFVFSGLLGNDKVQTRWMVGAWSSLDFLSNFWRVVIIGVRSTSFFDFFGLATLHVDQTWWMGEAWADFCFFGVIFWRVLMIGVCYRSFFVLFVCLFLFVWFFGCTSLHKAQTRCRGGSLVQLRLYFWVIFGELFLKDFTSFLDFFGCARFYAAQIWWVNRAWANFVYWNNMMASCFR